MRFDFLHDPQPMWIERICSWRMSERFVPVALALACTIATLTGAWAVESVRLAHARQVRANLRERLVRLDRETAMLRNQARRVHALAAFDRRLHRIRRSGRREAGRIAAIVHRVPDHIWLTKLGHEGKADVLQGRSLDLASLATLLEAFGRRRGVTTARLGSVRRMHTAGMSLLTFMVRLEARP
ncbi:MAG: PilN domain-containing protein [Vulcanimicrobiaceae bacterium]